MDNSKPMVSNRVAGKIRARYKDRSTSCVSIAKEFSVNRSTIYSIVRGINAYSHLDGPVERNHFELASYAARLAKKGEATAWLNYFFKHPKKTNRCVIWPFGQGQRRGHPLVNNPDKPRTMIGVSVVVCRNFHGLPHKENMDCAHSCGNGHLGCINPRHLRWASRQENVDEMKLHNTRTPGPRNGKMTKRKSEWIMNMIMRKRYSVEELGSKLLMSTNKVRRALRREMHIQALQI